MGWFLHTPFPSSEIYRTLPVREEVLRATLRADLIGFHTYDYARHFISSCTRILGLEGTPEGVEDNGRCALLGVVRLFTDQNRVLFALAWNRACMLLSKLSLEGTPEGVEDNGRCVRVCVYSSAVL